MTLAEEFHAWALDPARTNDELFTVELLVECGRSVWMAKHKQPLHRDWDAMIRHQKERRLNPAYRAVIRRESLDCAVEVASQIKAFFQPAGEDRTIRNLEALRFFPDLEEIRLSAVETVDVAPLAALRSLRALSFIEPFQHPRQLLASLDGLRGLACLETLMIHARTPWPDCAALGELPALRKLEVTINLLALRDVAPLPRVEVAILKADFQCKTPLRSLRDLPEMPEVRRLFVEGVASLDGVERYSQLINLEVTGAFRDLSPLAKLPQLTFVKMSGEQFTDLAPLSRAAHLREIVLVRERPLDLAILAEAPELRAVRVEQCPILAMEVSSLNAALIPWSVDFEAQPPRPLAPLRFMHYDPGQGAAADAKNFELEQRTQGRTDFYGFDDAFCQAEARWFGTKGQQRFDDLLGSGWGIFQSFSTPGGSHVTIRRYRDVMRFREIVETLRALSAESRFRWGYMIIVEPHGDMSEDLENLRKRQNPTRAVDADFDVEAERQEWNAFRERRRGEEQFLEREHRLNLHQQQGLEIDPSEFSPASEPPPPARKVAAEDAPADDADDAFGDNDNDDEDDDDEGGGIAEPPPGNENQSDLAADLGFIVSLTEDTLWVTNNAWDNAAYILDEQPVEWHPLPPEERSAPE